MVLDSLAPARRRFVLALLGIVAVVVIAVAALVVVRQVGGGDSVTPVAQDTQGPVLLVPGYGGSLTSLEVLGASLQKAGREVVLVKPPGDGTGDLADQAAHLGEVADSTLRSSGAPSVDVVGYSAGGVVVRYWVARDGGGNQARRVVTLASPHHGTALAELAAGVATGACPTACQELAPDSDLLAGLNTGDETPPGPQWVALWTTDDKTVVPPESGVLAGALSYSIQSVCPDLVVAHADVPRTPAVERMVIDALGVALPTKPTSSVC